MKRLTINRIAGAGLRANRRSYVNLAVGILLSIFLIAALCLCAHSVILAQEQKVADRVGYADAFLLDTEMTETELQESGYFDRIGAISVHAKVNDTDVFLGSYDETAAALMNRKCLEGRMPVAPGEIAAEQTTLDLLRMEISVGDTLALNLTPIDGISEARAYTLVGILNEQTTELDASSNFYSPNRIPALPALLVSPDEPAFTTGRTAVHRVTTTVSDRAKYEMLRANDESAFANGELIFAVDSSGRVVIWYEDLQLISVEASQTILMMAMLVGSLLLACCVGIASALEGQLARKTEEIGMLRAVGATRRQIRRIFGREAWLLALIVSPAAVGLACLFAWGASALFPEELIFRPPVLLLLPILLLSMAVILLASSLPLRRATQIMPMSVLRDTATLRKMRRMKSRNRFRASQLISWRQLVLHPTRLIAPSLLIGLMLIIVALTAILGADAFNTHQLNVPEFSVRSYYASGPWTFSSMQLYSELTDADIAQLSALPLVKDVTIERRMQINLLIDEVPEYFKPDDRMGFSCAYYFADDAKESNYDVQEHNAAREAIGTSKLLMNMNLFIMDLDDRWVEYLSEGEINAEAIDSGREILVYAPNYYGRGDEESYSVSREAPLLGIYDAVIENDFFYAGQTLDMVQLMNAEELYESAIWPQNQEEYRALYGQSERHDATVTVGAVLAGNLPNTRIWDACLITTEAGARAMGLNIDHIDDIGISLSAIPDEETEAALEARIERIAARADMEVSNALESRRQNRADAGRMALLFGAIAVVFLSVSISIISGNISRRIRADERKIGTLRAVGADERVLFRCYSGQIWLSVGLGFAVGAALFAAFMNAYLFMPSDFSNPVILALPLGAFLFLALALGACLLMLRMRLREITRRSIVENIREM